MMVHVVVMQGTNLLFLWQAHNYLLSTNLFPFFFYYTWQIPVIVYHLYQEPTNQQTNFRYHTYCWTMAAELAELQAALGRMGLEPVVVEFTHLKDTEVENLCKVICRPGGTIPNPQAGAARQPPTISDPGHAISLRSRTIWNWWCTF
jgi:hypothetical protein